MTKRINTAQALLAALASATISTEVEGYGSVNLRQITVADNDAVRAQLKEGDAPSEFGLRLLISSLVDDEGSAIFAADDIAALRQSSGTKIDALIKKVLENNGFEGTEEKNAQS